MAPGDRIASEEQAVLLNNREDPSLKFISKQQRKAGNVQVALLCWAFFLIGWGDGSTGPLIPFIQKDYLVSSRSRSSLRVLMTLASSAFHKSPTSFSLDLWFVTFYMRRLLL